MIKRITAVFLSLFFIIAVVFTSSANSIDDAKDELKQTQAEMNAIKKKKDEAKKTLLNDKKKRDEIIATLEQKGYAKTEIEAKIAEIESAIATLDEAIRMAQAEYDAQLKLFQDRMVALYIKSRTKSDLNMLLQCDSFEEMFRKNHMLKLIAEFDQEMIASIEAKQAEIDELMLMKQAEEDNAQEQLETMLSEIANLETSRSAIEDRVQKAQMSVKQLEKAEDDLEKQSKDLEKMIQKLQSSEKYTGGVMQWPLPGYYKISSPFGYRIHPILKYKKFHGGIDIGAPSSTFINAAAKGKVICASWLNGGSGYTVIIDHGGGITTLYFHIKKGGILVKEGQEVKAGQSIAKVGSTGLSTGPHLHFEVRKNGARQDPINYVTNKK